MSRLAIAALTLLLTAAVAVTGCAARPPAASATKAEPQLTAAPATQAEPLEARMMPYAKRKAGMPSGIPIEIPVIDGSLVSTSAPVSDSSWLYSLDTTGPVDAVSDWYRRAYENAGWQLAVVTTEGDTRKLKVTKGGAESVVDLAPQDGRVRVSVSIGLGQHAPSVY